MSILYDMRSGTLVKSKLFNNGLDLKDALTFNPLSLFKDGKQGVWYDPSDKSTLFQDVAGTVPVTKDGDPVGLILDKSQGLSRGLELTTNGSFTTDSGWSKPVGVTWTEDKFYRIEDIGGADGYMSQQLVGTVKNRLYEIRIEMGNKTAQGAGFRVRTGAGFGSASYGDYFLTFDANREFKFFILAGGDNFYITPHVSTTDTYVEIKSISVKEVKGNHASQPLAASRPVYKTDGILHWLEFDGADDYMGSDLYTLNTPTRIVGFKAYSNGFILDTRNVPNGASLYRSSTDIRALASGSSILTPYSKDALKPSVVCASFNGKNSKVILAGITTLGTTGVVTAKGIVIGSAGSISFHIRYDLYGIIDSSESLTEQEEFNSIQYLNIKSGVIL